MGCKVVCQSLTEQADRSLACTNYTRNGQALTKQARATLSQPFFAINTLLDLLNVSHRCFFSQPFA